MEINMIEVHIKEKYFKDVKILENIDLSIKETEFVSIIGPSGCGKTTLLNLISSLDDDFNAKVNISSSNIGFMFQDSRLIPWLSVKENLLIVSKNKNLDEIIELLELVGLKNILEEYSIYLNQFSKKYFNLNLFLFLYKNRELLFPISRKSKFKQSFNKSIGYKLYKVFPFTERYCCACCPRKY
jgi:ABC-type ATPase involved in cell division